MRNDTCKFYNGDWHNKTCLAGVAYADVTPDPDDIRGIAFRKPCIIWKERDWDNDGQRANYKRRGTCAKFELPTAEELAADEERHEKRLREVLASIERELYT